jgi:hypothetical protein
MAVDPSTGLQTGYNGATPRPIDYAPNQAPQSSTAPMGQDAWNAQQVAQQQQTQPGFQYSNYTPSQVAQLGQQYQTYTGQTNASNQVNSAFSSLTPYYNQIYNQTLNPAMSTLNHNYNLAKQGETYQSADSGQIGGSQDIYNQGQLANQYQQGIQNAQYGASAASTQAQTSNNAIQAGLLQAINTPNTGTTTGNAAYQAAASGLVSGQGQLNQAQLEALGITTSAQQLSSQAIGGLANTGASLVQQSPFINYNPNIQPYSTSPGTQGSTSYTPTLSAAGQIYSQGAAGGGQASAPATSGVWGSSV